jgi:YidC/Oxa1 family membrane protein insertase
MNRNAVIFVVASLGVLLLWNRVVDRYAPTPVASSAAAASLGQPPASGPAVSSVPAGASSDQASASTTPQAPGMRAAAEKFVKVETGAFQVELGSHGAQFTSLKLKGVRSMREGDDGLLDLVPSTDAPSHGVLELAGTDLDTMDWELLTPVPVLEGGMQVVRFGAKLPKTSLEFTKTFVFDPTQRTVGLEIGVRNSGKNLQNFLSPLSLVWGPDLGGDGGGIGRVQRAGVVQLADSVERARAGKDQQTLDYAAPRWVALKNHYFVVAFFPEAGSAWDRAEVRELGAEHLSVAMQGEGLSVAPGTTLVLKAKLWAGPQEYTTLKAVGDNFQTVVQFQFYSWLEWLNPFCVALLYILKWFHAITGNWGVAIILLTILVRGALFYPSMKSMVNMRHMQAKQAVLKPRLETLKKTYKDNPQKLNEETMKLYKEYGVNPLGGCLPMLIQIPVFFSLYDTLAAAYELRGAGFIWRWTDLTAADPTYLFPIAMGLSMFAQQKMSPTAAAASEDQQQMQKMMLWMMPIMFTGMALYMKWPLGLLLYWTASNAVGVLQQVVVNRVVD